MFFSRYQEVEIILNKHSGCLSSKVADSAVCAHNGEGRTVVASLISWASQHSGLSMTCSETMPTLRNPVSMLSFFCFCFVLLGDMDGFGAS